MVDKETVSDWGICLSRHLQVLVAFFPNCFPPNHVAMLEQDHFMVGYPNILKQWWPPLRPAHRKRLIPTTFRLQGKQRRKTPWSYPKAHKTKQLITLLNQELLVSSPCRSSKGTSQYLKCPPHTWHTWKRKAPERMRKWKVKTLTVSMGLLKFSWCTLQGSRRMPKWKRSTVIIAVAQSTLSATVH